MCCNLQVIYTLFLIFKYILQIQTVLYVLGFHSFNRSQFSKVTIWHFSNNSRYVQCFKINRNQVFEFQFLWNGRIFQFWKFMKYLRTFENFWNIVNLDFYVIVALIGLYVVYLGHLKYWVMLLTPLILYCVNVLIENHFLNGKFKKVKILLVIIFMFCKLYAFILFSKKWTFIKEMTKNIFHMILLYFLLLVLLY